MKTETSRTRKFLVLVPHIDIRSELRKNCDLAVKAGLTGAYSFPLVIPLVSLSQALEDKELKQIARSLRKITGKNKIFAKETAVTAFPGDEKDLFLYGPRLDIIFQQDFFKNISKKINYNFPSFIIGCFLKLENYTKLDSFFNSPQKELGFRAAAVANMYWRSLQINGEICYKWKIGKLFWLPHPQKICD